MSQELVTAAVLDALSNPDVIRRLVATVSPGTSDGSGVSSSAAAADGKFLFVLNSRTIAVFCGASQLIRALTVALLFTGASPLGDMPRSSELSLLGLTLAPGGEDPHRGCGFGDICEQE